MNELLEVKSLNKQFGDHTVLQDVTFSIKPGEIVGLVGRNGMGKTTLMKCILGLIETSSGSIVFDNDKDYKNKKEKMNKIGYLLDCKLFENMNAYENIKIQEMYRGKRYHKAEEKKIIDDILSLVDLKNDNKKVRDYSFGMKQRLGLALALLGDTKLLILDEPFVGLDPVGIQIIRDFIIKLSQEKNIAILISSHQLSEIENICDRFMYITNKHLYNYEQNDEKHITIEVDREIDLAFVQYFDMNQIELNGNKVSFDFEKKTLNDMLNYFVANNYKVNNLDIQKNGLESLFETGE